MRILSKVRSLGTAAVVAVVVAQPALAVDLTSVSADITTAGTDIATIGSAMLGLAVVAMTFKWLKASFF